MWQCPKCGKWSVPHENRGMCKACFEKRQKSLLEVEKIKRSICRDIAQVSMTEQSCPEASSIRLKLVEARSILEEASQECIDYLDKRYNQRRQ